MTKVVIAGAGFGGVRAGLDLAGCGFDVTLINDTPYHCYHADLYEVAAAKLEHENRLDFKDLRGTVNIPIKQIFKNRQVKVEVAKIKKIRLSEKTVYTSDKEFNYDYLVVALGSTTSFFGVKGAENFSHPIKTAEDALNIHNDLEEILRRRTDISVVIVGGGFTGVELAGELRNFLPKTASLTVVEGSEVLLGGMPGWAQADARKRLLDIGVQLKTGCTVEEVKKDSVVCGRENVGFDYLIWTAGVSGQSIDIDLEHSKKGQFIVNPDMSVEFPEVFVIGDLAEFKAGEDCVPATAWAAIGQAEVVAKNIKLKAAGKETRPYIPPQPAFVVPIGSKYAISNVLLMTSGILAWGLKRFITLKYFTSILPFIEAFEIWRKGVKIYTSND